ncbi:DMSO/selenate family reductase complex A subunit [Bacillus sp. REN3]|uniref:DMSO/selenate family reductase complex A subunit n=1 Tax=Bacillus sp. REN3 TaxID=2802440 RepID=UPI001AEE92DB|nr:DMSO/selenate family reductase complex A subunit [Bacillus sp. REN3]
MLENLFKKINDEAIPRRTFLKWTGAITAPAALGIGTTAGVLKKVKAEEESSSTEETIISTCNINNCGGRCVIKAHVKDGQVVRVTTDDRVDEIGDPQLRACVRGRGYRKMLYNPDRLKYPMKRTGKRGEGKFERISWDEATDILAREIKRIGDKYGPGSRYVNYATGACWGLYGPDVVAKKILSVTGGFLDYYNDYSCGAANIATPYTYGDNSSGSSFDNYLHSKYILLWGLNPTENIWSTPMQFYLKEAKKRGAKIVVIDPRYSDTTIALADEWIPILPTTDGAMMNAMMHVIITEKLYDQAFIDKYCIGFDEDHMPKGVPEGESLTSYILGEKDGIEKSPEWAEKICGVSARKIRQIAREYATAKPAALIQGYGPQRHMNGEQFIRCGTTLTSITGNVGKVGGSAAGTGNWYRAGISWAFSYDNPVAAKIPCFLWTEAIERGNEMTRENDRLLDADHLNTNIKMVFNMAGNILINQHGNINRTRKILEDESKVEFIVCSDIFMTPSAKFADLLLPATTFFERWDIGVPWCWGDYAVLGQKVVDPLYECRNEYDVFADVAKKLGVYDEYSQGGKSMLDLLKESIELTRQSDPSFPTFEEFKRKGIHVWKFDKPLVAYEEQIKDIENHPFSTPSGKIEIFSKSLWDMDHHDVIPAVGKYVEVKEGPHGKLREKYPIQLIGWHYKRRCHSTHDNHPWMEEVSRQEMWMNPEDAIKRGINEGDRAKVYNDRGTIFIPVHITNRVIPGVAAMPQGGWYTPDQDGNDTRGSINVITTHEPTPLAKANPSHTNLVEIAKA